MSPPFDTFAETQRGATGPFRTFLASALAGAALASYSTVPTVSGENWPGGTLTSVDAAPSGETSEALDWEVDGVSQAESGASLTLAAADLGLDVERVQVAQPGDVEVRSAPVEVVAVRGVTRGSLADDQPAVGSAPDLPSDCTILIRFIGIAGDATRATLLWWGNRDVVSPNRKGIGLGITPAGVVELLIYDGPNGPTIYTGPTITGAFDGVTRHIVALRLTGSTSMKQSYLKPLTATSVVTTTHTVGDATGTGRRIDVGELGSTSALVGSRGWAGSIDIITLDSVLTDGEIDDIRDNDFEGEDVWNHADLLWALTPASTEEDEDAVTDGAQLAGETWGIVSGSANCSIGGLNVEL